MYKKQLSIAIGLALLSACNNHNNDPVVVEPPPPVAVPVVSQGSLTLAKTLGEVVFSKNGVNSAPLALTVGFGSGAYHQPGDDNTIFYTVTDRGPNIDCSASEAIIGLSDFCPTGGDKVFPQAAFTPTIYKIQLTKSASGELGYEILAEIPLKKTNGEVITGLTNQFSVTDTEQSVGVDGQLLSFDNGGLDTEGLVRLTDGSFWLTDEYGPSLVHVASDGQIIKRVVPEFVAADLGEVGYPVVGLLPDHLKQRKLNRGIESIALAPDESALYFMLQSPLAYPDNQAYSQSRHVRLFKMALTDGDMTEVLGQYVYTLDTPATFADGDGNGDVAKKQSDVKISEMVAVGVDDLVVLERISQTTKFYRINLATGSNIHGQALATGAVVSKASSSPKTLEQVYDLASHNGQAVAKTLVFNTLTDMPAGLAAPSKIEGIALLDDQHVLLINDNDFGIAGDSTTAVILPIASRFTSSENSASKAKLALVARYESGLLAQSAAEIVAYHGASQRIYVVNAQSKQVDVLSGLQALTSGAGISAPTNGLSNPLTDSNLNKGFAIDTGVNYDPSGGVNSVAVHGNLLAVAVENTNKQAPGIVAFYQLNETSGEPTHLKNVAVGALPDNVQFSPDGQQLLVACEGEPSQDYQVDPEGSIGVIAINDGQPADTANLLTFTAFNQGGERASELPAGVRIFGGAFGGPKSTVAEDLEPEYVSFSADSKTAYVTLQENNAIAIVDLTTQQIRQIIALGVKDYSKAENALDISDKDKKAAGEGTLHHNGKGRINIKPWQHVVGMYQPDTVASYTVNGVNYIVTANEGDAREYIAGQLVEDYTSQASCEDQGLAWDSTVESCYAGDTPTSCATKGWLNEANEVCYSYLEEFRVESLVDDGNYADFIAPIPAEVAQQANHFSPEINDNITDEAYGRLKISIAGGVNGGNGVNTINQLHSYGARSFSIWNEAGQLVFDSGADIAKITAGRVGEFFNASNDKGADDKKNDRSSAKGAEPEALAIGVVNGKTYAFVGLERVGGIMMYDISNPYGVQFIEYTLNRDFTKNPSKSTDAGDVGPEGMKFVSAEHSPTGQALLIVGNEVSGSTSVYEVK